MTTHQKPRSPHSSLVSSPLLRRVSLGLAVLLVLILAGIGLRAIFSSPSAQAAVPPPPPAPTAGQGATAGVATYRASLPIPDSLLFAGERVPLELPDVLERLDREVIINAYGHSQTILCLKRAGRWRTTIQKMLAEQGIPPDFFYVSVAESALRNATSPAGAQGFWQFMPATARQYGLEVSEFVDERNDPIKSTLAACKYFKDAYRTFGNWTLVAGSYNMGMGGIGGVRLRQKEQSYYDLLLNQETSRYLFRIIALKLIDEKPEAYGFQLFPGDLYAMTAVRRVRVTQSIGNFAEWAQAEGSDFKTVQMLNPWVRKMTLPVGPGRAYDLNLPLGPKEKGTAEAGLVID
jgi:membrane-bound lytic murein transglycosylase D